MCIKTCRNHNQIRFIIDYLRINPFFKERKVFLMKAYIKDSRIIIECVLCAVAMMNIPVYDKDPFYIIHFLGILCTDCNIIKKAESHCPVPFSMVSGRPYSTKDIIYPVRKPHPLWGGD